MKIKYFLLAVITAIALAGCAEEYKTQTVDAIVIEKDYDAPKTTKKRVKQNGKYVTKSKKHPAEYDVTVSYNGIEEEFDDKKLYNSVKEGQKIKVTYKTGYDKNGDLVEESLHLID